MAFQLNQVARKPTKLPAVIKEALTLLRASLPSTIEINCNIAPEVDAVLAHGTQIHQIIMNLATNACIAISGGGRVDSP